MSDRSLVGLNKLAAAVGGLFALVGSAVAVSVASFQAWFAAYGGFMALLSLAFGVFVWLLVGQQPRNAVIWTMSAASFGAGWWLLGLGVASLIVRGDADQIVQVVSISGVVPAEVEPAAVRIMMLAESIGLSGLYLALTFGLLLFPDGSLPSRRWRWVGYYSGLAITLAFVSGLWAYRPSNTEPVTEHLAYGLSTTLVAVAFVSCLVALLVRFRQSRGSDREQFKWVVWGAGAFVAGLLVAIVLGDTLGLGFALIGEVVFLGAFAVAVGRYRLFDVDLVISRTLVLAGLAGFITLVYGLLVGAVGLLVGFGTNATLPLSIAATVIVAVAFQPLRQRMRRWADRLVYGDRATPYEVLSRFSSQVRDTVAADEAIPYLARLLALGTGAESTTVWIRDSQGLRAAGVWPEGHPQGGLAIYDQDLTIPGVDHLSRVEEGGELLGAVSVTMPANESLKPAEQRLIDDVASQAGMVLRNARLIQDLHASRQRLVAAQDDERRRIERNLHDGAQQQFVAVKMKASMAKQLVDKGDSDRAAELLAQVIADVDDGVQSLRELAHGIYPPLLEAEGLPTALRSQAKKAPIEVSVSTHGLGRYEPEIEAAIYFCALEAIQNAVKHGEANHVDVSIAQEGDELHVQITDDGRGFDMSTQHKSRGLVNMSDRIEALGGELEIRSAPGSGTSVIAHLSPPALEPTS
ncbi:MAG: sensor histidine kinase [Acidimicrobiia bacterium]|jgi:signal transduction histidine kinase